MPYRNAEWSADFPCLKCQRATDMTKVARITMPQTIRNTRVLPLVAIVEPTNASGPEKMIEIQTTISRPSDRLEGTSLPCHDVLFGTVLVSTPGHPPQTCTESRPLENGSRLTAAAARVVIEAEFGAPGPGAGWSASRSVSVTVDATPRDAIAIASITSNEIEAPCGIEAVVVISALEASMLTTLSAAAVRMPLSRPEEKMEG